MWKVQDADGERVLTDPNNWSGRDTDYVGAFEPSPDGRYVAYARHLSGCGYSNLHVLRVDDGFDLPEVIGRCGPFNDRGYVFFR
jgi:protease II